MSDQSSSQEDADTLQILITEHTNLQAARSATIFEANGRTQIYLSAVSSGIVALAFIGQVSEIGQVFFMFALILFPALIFLGIVTALRVHQTGMEDMIASRNINRIRHYYVDIAPKVKTYSMMSTHDDMAGYIHNMGAVQSSLQMFLSTGGLVSVINSILTAVFIGMLLFALFGVAMWVCVVVGIISFPLSVMLYIRYMGGLWAANEKRMKVLFPTPAENEPTR